MEKWKIGVIAALVLSLLGFGIYQQSQEAKVAAPTPTSGTPVPSPYVGVTLPAWSVKQWINTPKPVATAQLKGKYALVEIFRTECPHCRDAAPLMAAIDARYRSRGLSIVGLQSPGDFKNIQNPENNWKGVQQWVKERNLRYPIGFDEGSAYFQGTIKDKILGGDGDKLLYPTMLLVDPQGKIIFAHTGFDAAKAISLAVELEKHLPSSKSFAERAKDLAKWLAAYVPELSPEPNLMKALTDDLEQRLQSKIEAP